MPLVKWAGDLSKHWMNSSDEWPGRKLPVSVSTMWAWYASRSAASRLGYMLSEILALVLAASIPVAAVFGATPAWLALLGAAVALLGGMRTLLALHESWISYARTRYAIEREVVRWAHKRPPYTRASADGLLAAAAQELATAEGKAWVERRRAAAAAIRALEERPDDDDETGTTNGRGEAG